MLRHIEELRKKPKAVRNQYAFTIALSLTLLIVAVWAISLPARLSFEEPVIAKEADTGPSFTEQLTEVSTFLGEGIGEIKTQAELIGVTMEAGGASEPPLDTSPQIEVPFDTAHYDFFPSPADQGDSSTGPQSEENQ